MTVMVVLAILLGRRNRRRDERTKNRVLIWAAIVIDAVDLFVNVVTCINEGGLEPMRRLLPLFLCSIMLIALPLAAFSRGRLREAALDFVFIFGLLIAVMGTFGAAQNYSVYPVISLINVSSGLTHAISGFAALYIGVAGMASMKKANIPITFAILAGFCVAAYIADIVLDYNYMFLMRGDGTPYDIFYNLVNGNRVLYPLIVVALFLLYIVLFYFVFFLFRKKKKAKEPVRAGEDTAG